MNRRLLHLALLLGASPALAQSPDLVQTQRVESPQTLTGDRFGESVVLQGDTLVVGAYGTDDPDPSTPTCIAGAAYVYRLVNGVWVETQRLTAVDAACRAAFGWTLALEGDVLLVGAPWHDGTPSNSTNCNAGAVYVYRRSGGGDFDFVQRILTPGTCGNEFGRGIGIHGDELLISADRHDNLTGRVWSYVLDPLLQVWVLNGTVLPASLDVFDRYGVDLDVDGDTLVVGASGAGASSDGEVVVFEHDGSQWVETQRLGVDPGSQNYGFGRSVSLSGNTLAVGLPGANANQQRVDLFERGPTGFAFLRSFHGPSASADSQNYFGDRVALDGDTLVVAESGFDGAAPGTMGCNSGSVRVYRRTGPGFTDWAEQRLELLALDCGDHFAWSVAVDGERVVAGAPQADGLGGAPVNGGVAAVFERDVVGSELCFGVGCPCGNDDPSAGCANRTGHGARLSATGSTSVTAADLRVRVSGLPPGEFALFTVGLAQAPAPLGGGLGCLQAPWTRYSGQVGNAFAGGTHVLDDAAADSLGTVVAGGTFAFQCLYREQPGASCGTGFLASSALAIPFTP